MLQSNGWNFIYTIRTQNLTITVKYKHSKGITFWELEKAVKNKYSLATYELSWVTKNLFCHCFIEEKKEWLIMIKQSASLLPGSPNLQLNSRTLGPLAVNIIPANRTPTKSQPSFLKPSTAFCRTSLEISSLSFMETWFKDTKKIH